MSQKLIGYELSIDLFSILPLVGQVPMTNQCGASISKQGIFLFLVEAWWWKYFCFLAIHIVIEGSRNISVTCNVAKGDQLKWKRCYLVSTANLKW